VVVVMVPVRIEKVGIEFCGPIQVESADFQHLLDLDLRAGRAVDHREGIDRANALLRFREFLRRGEVAFVQQDHISKSHLLLGLMGFADMSRDGAHPLQSPHRSPPSARAVPHPQKMSAPPAPDRPSQLSR
jgi:hypothetical protein